MTTRESAPFGVVMLALLGVMGSATATAQENRGTFESDTPNTPAVMARATKPGPGSNAVHGVTGSPVDSAIYGEHSGSGIGVFGRGGPSGGEGVFGQTAGSSSGVYGKNTTGSGVTGESQSATGVAGVSGNGAGVSGTAANVGVYAHNTTVGGNDAYLASRCCAGDFNGDVFVHGRTTTQVLEITGGTDLAEPFRVEQEAGVQPGMVVAIDPAHPGELRLSNQAYDRSVAGIVAGANGIHPGLTLTSNPTAADHLRPVALTGRVYAWADATHNPIQPGDLLTTGDVPGHAMKVIDYARAQGAILGKAMSALPQGTGLVLVLVSLQ